MVSRAPHPQFVSPKRTYRRAQGVADAGDSGSPCDVGTMGDPSFAPPAGRCRPGRRVVAVSVEERQRFAVLPAEGHIDGIDLALLDPADEDERRLLIESEHPELRRALTERREIRVGRDIFNPVLHIATHEIVANQLWVDDPPEVWVTAQRLLADGYDRHDVLHMLASVVAGEVFEILGHEQSHDIERVRRALAALPGEWEKRRADLPAERHQNRAERRTAARRHRK